MSRGLGDVYKRQTETRVPSKRDYRYISREDWICVKGGHEAIVTEQELQKVQDMVQKDRKYHGSTPSSENIFAGLIRCGHCGRKMRIRTEYKEKPIYCKSVTTAPNASCYPKKYKQKELEELVLIMIRQQAALVVHIPMVLMNACILSNGLTGAISVLCQRKHFYLICLKCGR